VILFLFEKPVLEDDVGIDDDDDGELAGPPGGGHDGGPEHQPLEHQRPAHLHPHTPHHLLHQAFQYNDIAMLYKRQLTEIFFIVTPSTRLGTFSSMAL
jgi:hypothetical protein